MRREVDITGELNYNFFVELNGERSMARNNGHIDYDRIYVLAEQVENRPQAHRLLRYKESARYFQKFRTAYSRNFEEASYA